MRPTVSRRGKQRGLTIIEIMVALTISLILTLGVVQIFSGTRATYRFQEALSRVQENGRFVLQTLARDFRQLGYSGCVRGDDLEYNNNVETADGSQWDEWNLGSELLGYEHVGGTWSPEAPDVPAATHSSAIRVKVPGGPNLNVTQDPSGANIKVSDGSDLFKCQVVMVNNCRTADIFVIVSKPGSDTLTHSNAQQCDGSDSATNIDNFLSNDDYTGGNIVQMDDLTFFLQDDDGDTIPELWRRTTNGSATPVDEKLVEGVEQMQLRYGEDDDGDSQVDEYRLADAVSDWSAVVAIRISVLMVSPNDNVTEEPQGYTFAGTTVSNPGDNRLRQVFTKTVALRNRIE